MINQRLAALLTIGCVSCGDESIIETLCLENSNVTCALESSDEEAVHQVVLDMTRNFEEGNIDMVMSFYADEATVVFQPMQPVSRRDLLINNFKELSLLNPDGEWKMIIDNPHGDILLKPTTP